MKSRILSWSIFTLVLLFSFNSFAENDAKWKLIKNAQGVKVYSRPFPGSAYQELYADGYEVVPFEVGVEFVKDCDAYHEWYGMCKELYVTKKYSEQEYDMYFVLDTPVVKNRDVVVKVKTWWDIEKGNGWVTVNSIESDYKKNSGYVRMPQLQAKFIVKRMDDGRMYVKYQLHAEMGGSVPASIVNMIASKHPYLTAIGAKKNVHKKKYYEQASKLYGKQFTPPQ